MKTLLARWSRFPRVSAKTRGDTAPFFMLVVFNFLYPIFHLSTTYTSRKDNASLRPIILPM